MHTIAIENHDSITAAWKRYGEEDVSTCLTGAAEGEDASEFVQILHQSHEQYAAKHTEKLQLIESRVFVKTLAASIEKLDSPISLTFSDGSTDTMAELDLSALLDKNQLARVLSAPCSWRILERIRGPPTLAAIQILSDLPVALQNEGVAIQELKISCFPKVANYSFLSPSLGCWADLSNAYESLEEFRFRSDTFTPLGSSRDHSDQLPEEGIMYLEKHLAAILSSQRLEVLSLDFYGYRTYQNHSLNSEAAPLGSILQSIQSSRIENLSIAHLSFVQDDLLQLLSGIQKAQDSDSLLFILLWGIHLREGTWAVIFDRLHEMAANQRCRVNSNALSGGELGATQRTYVQRERGVKLKLIEAIEVYLSGDRDVENPLR